MKTPEVQSVAADPPSESICGAMRTALRYRGWLLDLVEDALGRRILEVGAGHGTYTGHFADRDLAVVVDLFDPYIKYLQNRFPGTPYVIQKADIADPGCVPELSKHAVDTIVCLNVLEHIEDDTGALANMRKILSAQRGKLALIVPALPALYGDIDRLVGHFRRYTLPELSEKVRGAGFTVDRIRYFNSVGGVGWFLNAKLKKYTSQDDSAINAQVQAFDSLAVSLARVIDYLFPIPFGQSLVCLATARDA